jgi:hypothetical protein
MKNIEFVPANFRFSRRASAKLNELTEVASVSTSRSMVPLLAWGEEYDEIKRELVVLGMRLAWDYLDEAPSRLLQEVDGVTLVFVVTPKQAPNYLGKEIDYDGDIFFLADRT